MKFTSQDLRRNGIVEIRPGVFEKVQAISEELVPTGFGKYAGTIVRDEGAAAELKQDRPTKQVGSVQAQEGNVESDDRCNGRIVITIRCYAARRCDPDNLYVKDLIDGLRHAGLIPEDDPDTIELNQKQFKVTHKSEERVAVTIKYPMKEETQNAGALPNS